MIEYRQVKPEEMDSVMDLVVRTFTGEQGIPAEMNYLPPERTPQWFCAAEDGAILGTVACFREEDGWHAGRFAIEPALRGRHIGTPMISHAFSEMFASGVEEIRMEGRPATVHILTKLGAEITGEPFPFYSDTCTPLLMTRACFRPKKQN